MKSRLKRKLAALLAFAMIATSVMPAMADVDLEVLPEKAETVEISRTEVEEVSAEVNEIEEIETGAAEAPEPVSEAEEAADTVEEKENGVTMEIEAETDTAGGETRNTVPAEVVSGESVTGGEIFAVDDIFEVEEVTEAEPADIAYSETDETTVLSSGADDSPNFIVEISYNGKKYELVAPGNELLYPAIMNALGVPKERRDGFSTSDPGKEYFSIEETEIRGQARLSVKKRFDGEQYIDVKLFSGTYRLTLKCKELPPVTYVTYDSGEREEITTTDYYYALTAGSFQSGKFYVVDRSFVRTGRITNYADVDHPAHLILMDGCKMTVNGGIQNCSGHSLIIHQGHKPEQEGNGTGELVCTTSEGGWEEGAPNPDFAAAIGGDQNNGSGGHLRIDGGIITATSGTWDSAGIGGSYDSGYITINGGSVTATGGGPRSAVGIGAGGQGKVNNITINGGYVNASGTTNGIGGGTYNTSGEIIINGGKVDAAGGTGMGGGNNLTVTITGGEVLAKSWGSDNPAFRGNKPVIAEGFTVLGGKAAGNATKKDISSYDFRDSYVLVLPVDTNVSYMDENGQEKNHECTIIRIPDRKTEIRFENDGWYALYDKQVLDTRIVNNADSSHPAHLILMDGCSLTSTRGISNKSGKALIIYGQNGGTGELNINTGTSWDAGIGGDNGTGAGNLTLCGGIINITSKGRGAAIGGGHKGNGGTLNVYNGKVDVYCTDLGAGIGGGGAEAESGSGGRFNMYGGTVNAHSTGLAAAIGGGGNLTTIGGGGAYVNVFGGTIIATCDGAGAAIGGGGEDFKWRGGGNGGSLVFCEGEITAYSARAHGIGAGNCANNQALGYMGSIVAGKDTTVEFGESPENHHGSGLEAYISSPNHYIHMKSKEGVYVSFHTDGGSSVEPQEITSGATAKRPADPTKAGYKFKDWYADSACTGDPFNFESVITEDTILYAKWEIDPGKLECPVYWYLDDAGKLTIASYALPSLEGKAKVHGAFDANHPFAECADTWADHKESIKRVYSATEVNPRYCDHWFEDCYYLESADLTALGTAETSNIISMASMFSYCTALSYINLSNVNTSNVADMSNMFEDCASLSSVEFGDSSAAAFQTGNVSRMDGMFKSCSSLEKVDLSGFDFQNVTDLSEFLFMCESLETITWPENPDVSKVTTFWRTFSYCGSLKALDLSGFTASGATETEEMFKNCSLLEELDVTGFAASPLEDIISMFEGCSSLRTIYALDTQAFCSNSVTLSENAFTGCLNLAGGNGTKYDALRTDKSLAKVDKEGEEGYFTQKGTGKVLLVTYEENNGNRPKQETVLSGEKATNYTPEYPGSRFLGWFSDPGLTASYSFDTPVTADITLYAKWEQLDKISVSFNTMGGSYIEPQIIVKYTKAATPSVAPTKTGHTFAGWYQEEGCTNTFDFNQEISANTTVYAKWIAEEYTVTWLVEGQEASSTYTYGEMPSYGGTPVKTGHTFVGWEPSLKPVTKDAAYTARFDKNDDTTHVVYFDANGGTVSPVSVEVTDNNSIQSVPEPVREGYNFVKWLPYTINDKQYSVTDIIDTDGIIFTAEWSPIKIDITWDVEGSKTTNSYEYGSMPVYNNGTDPVKTGYLFAGWIPKIVPATTPSTYTAKFMEDEQFTVFFNTMGGSPVSTQIVEKGAKAARPSAVPKKDGYTFSDWYRDEKCTEKFDFENAITGSVTVYAGWTPDKYSITWSWLKADGTEGILTEDSKYEYGQLPVFPEGSKEQLKKPGYVHTGWNPSVTVIGRGSARDIRYEAVYERTEEGRHIVNFDTKGGSAIAAVSVIDGKMLPIPEDPVRAGYSFDGWYTEKEERYVFNRIPVTADMTLIAGWKPMPYQIVWKDGDTVLKEESVDYDTLPDFGGSPEKEGYYFLGWDPAIKTVTGPQTYQAVFIEKDKEIFIVSFETNGGTHVSIQKVESEKTASQPAKPAKSGYTFVGWYLDEKFTTEYKFTEAVTEDITLYAKWKYNGSSSGGGGGGGGGVILSGAAKKVGAGYSFSPNWYSDEYGVWRIRNSAGQTVANAWLCDDVIPANGKEVWYLLTADGAMIANGLVQDNTGNFYSLETEHNGYFGMLRYQDGTYNCNGQQVYLTFNREHKGSFGAITNPEGLEKLKQIYGVTQYGIGNENSVYTASF